MEPSFSLFVSCIEGKPVTRHGSRTFIGAEREQGTNVIHWFPDRVVAIPEAEHNRYRKEYDRLVRDGDLKLRDESDWRAQNTREDAAVKAAEKTKAAAAAAAKKADEAAALKEKSDGRSS